MATSYLAPGVYFEQADTAARVVAPLRTDVAAFVGIAERGPLHRPVAVHSWDQFTSAFGGLMADAFLAYSVRAFFENGGRECWIVRVAAEEAVTAGRATTATTVRVDSIGGFVAAAVAEVAQVRATSTDAARAQPSDRRSSVLVDTAGLARGSLVRLFQAGASVTYRSVLAVDMGSRSVTWDRPLEPVYDLTQPIALTTRVESRHSIAAVDNAHRVVDLADALEAGFATGAGSPPVDLATGAAAAHADALAERGAAPALRISARSPGAWGDAIAVRIGRAHAAGTTTRPALPGDPPRVCRVNAIAGLERGTVVRATQGAAVEYLLLADADPAGGTVTFTAPPPATLDRATPISLESVELTLAVEYAGSLRELYAGLSPVAGHPRYAPAVVTARSQLIAAEDPIPVRLGDPAPPYPARLPDVGASNLDDGMLRLRGGRDGLAGIRARDFRGDPGAVEKHGLRALEDVDEVAIVAVPDILVQPAPRRPGPAPPPAPDPCVLGAPEPQPPEPAPSPAEHVPHFSLDDVVATQQALVDHCEARADRFALIDPPPAPPGDDPAQLDAILAWCRRFDTSYAGLYYPWVLVYDPLAGDAEDRMRALPPSGHVAGAIARTDLETGVHKAPANVALEWAQAFTADVGEPLQEVLNPLRVNCLRALPGRGLRVYGARTLSSDPQWRFTNVRRLLMMIEKAVCHATQWSVFEPNGFYLRARVAAEIASFLRILWRAGALAGASAEEAFFVRAGEYENPPDAVANGEMLAIVGVAPVMPAEFVVFRIGFTEGALEVVE